MALIREMGGLGRPVRKHSNSRREGSRFLNQKIAIFWEDPIGISSPAGLSGRFMTSSQTHTTEDSWTFGPYRLDGEGHL
ncbi:MAG: hypothetical protein VKK99_01830, partial [Cyanobacteriota bacterium]|nr:hypothetical protein [Cyanobacteriota bacterium]